MFKVQSGEEGLLTFMQTATFQNSNELIFTTGSMLGLILFFMVAMQCGATLAVARKEMGSWKLPLIQLGGYISIAYLLAIIANTFI